MRNRFWRIRTLVAGSALVLAAGGCANEHDPDEPAAATADEAEPLDDVEAAEDEAVDDEAAHEGAGGDGHERAAEGDAEPADASEVGDAGTDLSVTAYVVAYHWGFALFDEVGSELDVLEVPVGAEVELIAVNDHARHAIDQLPPEVGQAILAVDWHERAHHVADELPGLGEDLDKEAMSLSEALQAAHDGHDHTGPVQDHGLMVTGIGAEVVLDAHADGPEHLVFTVEREGTFQFRCTVDCGVGHDAQRQDKLIVNA